MKRFWIFGSWVFCAGVFHWLSFRSNANDWGMQNWHAAVISTSGLSWDSFPFFSYLYNGGAYLFQDPQSFVSSPTMQILVRGLGSLAGAHAFPVVWMTVGWWGLYLWLRPRLSPISACFASVAWCLSLGFFWRLVAGHAAFMMHFALPWILIALDRMTASGLRLDWRGTAVALGLFVAWLEYEPGFHSLFYVIVPAAVSYVLLLYAKWPNDLRKKLTLGLFLAGIVGALALLPKLISWARLPMERAPDRLDGVLVFRDVLYGLFATARAHVLGFRVPGVPQERWHAIWEVNHALFAPASVLAGVALLSGLRPTSSERRDPRWLLGACALSLGLALAGSTLVWSGVQALTTQGIRVPSRFLGLSAFGLAVLSAFGFERLWKDPRMLVRLIALFSFLGALILPVEWLSRAQKLGTILREPVAWIDRGDAFAEPFRSGQVVIGLFCAVGSGCQNPDAGVEYLRDPYLLFLKKSGGPPPSTPVIRYRHREIEVTDWPASEALNLGVRGARLGQFALSDSKNLALGLFEKGGTLWIKDEGADGKGSSQGAKKVLRVRPILPFPAWSWVLSLAINALGVAFVFSQLLNDKRKVLG